MSKTVLFTSEDIPVIRKLQKDAEEAGKNTVVYKDNEYDTRYLKYLIEYLEFKGL